MPYAIPEFWNFSFCSHLHTCTIISNWWRFVLFKLFHSECLAENVAQKELQRSWEQHEDLEKECDKGFDSINLIVADTTSVNTGKQSGVVVRLQRMFNSRGHQVPQFISCQHHVLDRILRLVMDQELGASPQTLSTFLYAIWLTTTKHWNPNL